MSDIKGIMQVLNALLSIHRDAANVRISTRHTGPKRQPQKCSMIEKYLKFPLCFLFLIVSITAEEKSFNSILKKKKKKYHMDPSEPFDFQGMKPNAGLSLGRRKDCPSPPALNPILLLSIRAIIKSLLGGCMITNKQKEIPRRTAVFT